MNKNKQAAIYRTVKDIFLWSVVFSPAPIGALLGFLYKIDSNSPPGSTLIGVVLGFLVMLGIGIVGLVLAHIPQNYKKHLNDVTSEKPNK